MKPEKALRGMPGSLAEQAFLGNLGVSLPVLGVHRVRTWTALPFSLRGTCRREGGGAVAGRK